MAGLMFPLIFMELAVIMNLLFVTPFTEQLILVVDWLKRGETQTAQLFAFSIFMVLISRLYLIKSIMRNSTEAGGISLTDQVRMERHRLEVCVWGFCLFFMLLVERLHHYIMELRSLRKSSEAINALENANIHLKEKIKQDERAYFNLNARIKLLESECERKAKEAKAAEERAQAIKSHSNTIIFNLEAEIKQLESECERKAKEAKVAEASELALKKQSEGFLLEYDRLLEDNNSLRNQLKSIDLKVSHYDRKKNT